MADNFNSHGQPLDGSGSIKPTPFDQHEQNVRNQPGYKPEENGGEAVDD